MHLLTKALLATTAAALAIPAAAQDGGETSCAQEVAAFLETLRADETFPRIEASYPTLEAELAGAVESDAGVCLAVLADLRTLLFEDGHVVTGATDRDAVDRGRTLALRAGRAHFDMGGSETAGTTAQADVVIREPEAEPELTIVSEAESDVTEDVPADEADDADGADNGEDDGAGTGAVAPAAPAGNIADEIARSRRDFGRAAAGTGGGDIGRAVEEVATIAVFAVREVEFATDSATVPRDEVTDALTEVARIVENEPDSAVLLIGHERPVEAGGDDRDLSEERLDAVRIALVELGVPEGIIRTHSRDEAAPEVAAGEDERAAQNRRVEIRVLDVAAGAPSRSGAP